MRAPPRVRDPSRLARPPERFGRWPCRCRVRLHRRGLICATGATPMPAVHRLQPVAAGTFAPRRPGGHRVLPGGRNEDDPAGAVPRILGLARTRRRPTRRQPSAISGKAAGAPDPRPAADMRGRRHASAGMRDARHRPVTGCPTAPSAMPTAGRLPRATPSARGLRGRALAPGRMRGPGRDPRKGDPGPPGASRWRIPAKCGDAIWARAPTRAKAPNGATCRAGAPPRGGAAPVYSASPSTRSR